MQDETITYRLEIERLNAIIAELTSRVEQFEYILQQVQQATNTQNDASTASTIKRSAWSIDEHRRFVQAARILGRQKAKEIATQIETRSAVQVHSHSQKYFLKLDSLKAEAYDQTCQAMISTFRPIEGLQQIGPIPENQEDIFLILLPKICMIEKGYYFAGSFGRRTNSVIPLTLLRIGINQILTYFNGQLTVNFNNFQELNAKQIQCVSSAFHGIESDLEEDFEVMLNVNDYKIDGKHPKKQMIYYNPDQLIPYLELIIAWFMNNSSNTDNAIFQCLNAAFLYNLACNQLQDSPAQNVILVAMSLEIPAEYTGALILAQNVFNSFIWRQ
ncbi:Myb-like DNA-binding domain-containing protein [Spironucleus salmonicida]|uniref:Myb-like DNA-binding domain-containing protein n=1 Tax=Spironucleus salmonicida TaxID=348837 RepID=V6LID2_9EUKA|nr:Myb-like DNA-binding domain-containing protein [Spironucleus salmonicida]|eukprot:EST44073.1 Myb-like DNA-binding domain-containing protein [Spironucleus salmonicida]